MGDFSMSDGWLMALALLLVAGSLGMGWVAARMWRWRSDPSRWQLPPRPASSGRDAPEGDAAPASPPPPFGARFRPEPRGYSLSYGLMQEVTEGLRKLPPFPEGLLRIVRELDAEAASADSVAAEVEREPVVAATLLRIANSAATGMRREVVHVPEAIAYLGFSTTKSLLLRFKIDALFPHQLTGGYYDGPKIWVHSIAVAQAAEELARRAGGIDPELALTGGLLHDIGKFAINCHFRAAARQLAEKPLGAESILAREQQAFGADHAGIGAALAEQWKLPADLTAVIRFHHSPEAATDIPPEARRTLLAVCTANRLVKYSHVYCDEMEIDPVSLPMLAELGLPPEADQLLDARLQEIIRRAILVNGGAIAAAAAPQAAAAA